MIKTSVFVPEQDIIPRKDSTPLCLYYSTKKQNKNYCILVEITAKRQCIHCRISLCLDVFMNVKEPNLLFVLIRFEIVIRTKM